MNTRTLVRVALATMFLIGLFLDGQHQAYALGTPRIIKIDPSSPRPVGTCVTVEAEVTWDSDFRSMRMRFGNGGWEEEATPKFSRTFCTSHLSPAWYTIRVEVDRQGGNWSNPTWAEASYELTAGSAPPTATPAPETPYGPVVSQVNFSPDSATVGQTVGIHIKVESTNPGAIRIYIPCGSVAHFEHTVPEYDTSWNTGGCGGGWQNVRVCARHVNDPNWQYAYCVDRSYLLNQPVSQAPSADFWADTGTIQQGQCTWIHWRTQNANTVDIDGAVVGASGDSQVCPTVTKHYSLKAVGAGGEATRSLSIVVSVVQQPPPVVSKFSTGDVIQIGYDVFVIYKGVRRLVPNPDTLDALGIPRSWINNKGFSEAELNTILRGADIPDVNRDRAGFDAFKREVFPNTTSIKPRPTKASPTSSSSQQGACSGWNGRMTVGQEGRVTYTDGSPTRLRVEPKRTGAVLRAMPEGYTFKVIGGPVCVDGFTWWQLRAPDGLVGWSAEGNSSMRFIEPWGSVPAPTSRPNPTRAPQPTAVPPTQPRSTAVSGGSGASSGTCSDAGEGGPQNLWDKISRAISPEVKAAGNPFPEGQCTYLVAERRPDVYCWLGSPPRPAYIWDDRARENGAGCAVFVGDKPQTLDIAVWEKGCGDADTDLGHVAYVTSVNTDGTISVDEDNWDRDHTRVQVSSCMSFIHWPTGMVGETPSTPESKEPSLLERFIAWIMSWFK